MTPTAMLSDVVFSGSGITLSGTILFFLKGNFLLYSAKAVMPPPGVKNGL